MELSLEGLMAIVAHEGVVLSRYKDSVLFRDGKYPAPFANVYPATAAGKVLWNRGARVDLRAAPPARVEPVPTPKPVPPVPARPEPNQPAKRGFWEALAAVIANLFGRR